MRKPTPRESVYLVVLSAVAIGYFVLGGGDVLTGGSGSKEAEALFIGEAPIVDVARLNLPPDDYDIRGRNLFQYGSPPQVRRTPPPPPPPTPVPTPRPVRTPPPPRTPAPATTPRVVKRQPPRPQFDYLGYLGPKENRIAVFEDKKKQKEEDPMILARTGEVVHHDFIIVEFKYETVVLGYTDKEFEGQTTELQIKKK